MEAEPPVEADHPLHSQSPNTLSFESSAADSIPIRIPYDSIGKVEPVDWIVRITLGPAAPIRWVGVVEIITTDVPLAARLVEDIRGRRVRRIQPNQAVY